MLQGLLQVKYFIMISIPYTHLSLTTTIYYSPSQMCGVAVWDLGGSMFWILKEEQLSLCEPGDTYKDSVFIHMKLHQRTQRLLSVSSLLFSEEIYNRGYTCKQY